MSSLVVQLSTGETVTVTADNGEVEVLGDVEGGFHVVLTERDATALSLALRDGVRCLRYAR